MRRDKKRKGVYDMLSQKAKDLFGKLGCEFQPVAIKYCYAQPEGVEHVDETLSLCQFAKKAAVENKAFYITKDDENCMGKMILGMEPKPALGASGQAGKDFGVYKSQAPNARLYHEISCLNLGTTNFVVFSPVAICDFDPDLVFFVADFEQADVLLRATSYISGDLWESRCSCVRACLSRQREFASQRCVRQCPYILPVCLKRAGQTGRIGVRAAPAAPVTSFSSSGVAAITAWFTQF